MPLTNFNNYNCNSKQFYYGSSYIEDEVNKTLLKQIPPTTEATAATIKSKIPAEATNTLTNKMPAKYVQYSETNKAATTTNTTTNIATKTHTNAIITAIAATRITSTKSSLLSLKMSTQTAATATKDVAETQGILAATAPATSSSSLSSLGVASTSSLSSLLTPSTGSSLSSSSLPLLSLAAVSSVSSFSGAVLVYPQMKKYCRRFLFIISLVCLLHSCLLWNTAAAAISNRGKFFFSFFHSFIHPLTIYFYFL